MQSYTYLALANAIATVGDRLSLSTGYLYWERQGQYQDDKAPTRTSNSESLLLTTANGSKTQVEAPKGEEGDTKQRAHKKERQTESPKGALRF